MALFLIVFYMFSMLAYYAFKDLGILGQVFSEQLNFSTFGDSCLAMFQATSLHSDAVILIVLGVQIFVGAGW